MKNTTLGTAIFALLLSCQAVLAQSDVLTQHNDINRTGWNNNEPDLTPSTVSKNTFGLLFSRSVDDQVYAQPLLASNVDVGGTNHNILIVATVNNTVYAFDGDDPSTTIWSRNLTTPGRVPPINYFMHPPPCGGGYQDFSGQMGIVGTPVIDKASKTLYVLTRDVNTSMIDQGPHSDATLYSSAGFYQLLHAIDITTGLEKFGGPVTVAATYPGSAPGSSGGVVTFDPRRENQRAGLLLLNGIVYIAYAGHCDWNNYGGWVLGYSATDLSQKVVFLTTPNDGRGGVWQSGAGLAAESNGNIYIASGNSGGGDATVPENRGESLIRATANTGTKKLDVQDWFTPTNYVQLNNSDYDFGSQILLVPNSNLLISGAKDGNLYLLDRTNMGKYNSSSNQISQTVFIGANAQMHSSLAYFGAATPQLYQFSEYTSLKSFPINGLTIGAAVNGSIAGPNGAAGAFMSVSSPPDASSGILWVTYPKPGCSANQNTCPGILRAMDALNVKSELWNSDMNSTDVVGNYAKTACPTVANGKVYLATFSNKVNVYGIIADNAVCVTNVALNKTATSSGSNAGNTESDAVDGDQATFWSSTGLGSNYLQVDLGADFDICRIVINWLPGNEGKDFKIQVSDDPAFVTGVTTVKNVTGNTVAVTEFAGAVTGRYVRMQGVNAANFRYDINEFQVYGSPANTCTTPKNLNETAITMNTATLSWDAVPGATSYLVSYKSTLIDSWITRTVTGTTLNISALSPGTDYVMKVLANCGGNQSDEASDGFSTVDQTNPCPLFTRFTNADIGDIGVAGSSCYAGSTFTITGSGTDIGTNNDEFQFAWTPLTANNNEFTVRIATQDNTSAANKAGLMMRDSLSNTSRFAFIGLTSGGGVKFMYRTGSFTNAVTVNGPAVTAPYYVRLVEAGSVYSAYVSSTGATGTWVQIGSSVDLGFGLASTVYTGFAVTSNKNSALSTATFDNFENSTLPINLSAFDVRIIDNSYTGISWSTAQEVNNDYFEVQRSANGSTYEDLIRVKAVGNSNVIQSYTATDNNPLNGINFYRLKQVDLDGKTSYFPAKFVRFGKGATPIVYPNPMVSMVNVVAGDDAVLTISLYSVSGKKIREINNDSGLGSLTMPTGDLTNGIYIIKMKTAKKVYQQKLIKE